MAVTTCLARPTRFQCVQWDGANSDEVNTVLSAVGWSFTVEDGSGTAHAPTGGSLLVDPTTWIVCGSSAQFLSNDDFTAGYIAGSIWTVAP